MKRAAIIFPLAFILYACPYESRVPLATGPAEPVDTTLLGYWYGIVKDGSDFFGIEALDITRESDSVYAITRYGKAIKGDIIMPDTAYFKGYISYVGNQRFMNVEGNVVITTRRGKKPPLVQVEKVYYISAIGQRNDTLSVKTITEQFSGNRVPFSNPAQLREEVTQLLDARHNIYDDVYSMSYRKIPRPQPMKAF